MQSQFPAVSDYLMNITPSKWISYAQVESGMTAYKCRTSNMAEIGQLATLRAKKLHPMDYICEMCNQAINALCHERTDHENWSTQEHELVPYAREILEENIALSASCEAIGGSGVYLVTYVDSNSSEVHKQRKVNLTMKTCSCNQYQDLQIPCLHAVAAILTLHNEMLSLLQVMEMYGSNIYRVREGIMDDVIFEHVIAPDVDILRAKHGKSTDDRLQQE